MAIIRSLSDFLALQLADEFGTEVHRLVEACPKRIDLKYQSQLLDATDGVESNLAEGYRRGRTGEFTQFTRYALASLAEARVRLRRGISRGYFSERDCAEALSLGKRCDDATAALLRSLVERQRRLKNDERPRGTTRRSPARPVKRGATIDSEARPASAAHDRRSEARRSSLKHDNRQ
jgi:four helix bundle protein